MEPPFPIQALGVNPFPSRFIIRTVPRGDFSRLRWEEPITTTKSASFPVVLSDFGCDVTCQACRENSPRTPRAIALGSKPPLVTRIARTGLGTRLPRNVTAIVLHQTAENSVLTGQTQS